MKKQKAKKTKKTKLRGVMKAAAGLVKSGMSRSAALKAAWKGKKAKSKKRSKK